MLITFLCVHAAQAISGKDNTALQSDVRNVTLDGGLLHLKTHGLGRFAQLPTENSWTNYNNCHSEVNKYSHNHCYILSDLTN